MGKTWVYQKWEKGRGIAAEALANTWNDLRGAIQDACNEYNQCFCGPAARISCNLENGHRVTVTVVFASDRVRRFKDETCTATIFLDSSGPCVRYARSGCVTDSGDFPIISQGMGILAGLATRAGQAMSPEKACEFILEPILFPEGFSIPRNSEVS